MSLEKHILTIIFTFILVVSFSLQSLSSYPLSQGETDENDPWNVQGNIMSEDVKEKSYYGYFSKVISDHFQHSPHTLARALAPSASPPRIANVDHFIRPRERADHTKAFRRAWKAACSTKGGVFLVPRSKYNVRPITFSGPCQPNLVIKILGKIEASVNETHYRDRQHWLVFQNIHNFKVQGGGTIDGKGKIWWQNSCKINKTKPCKHAPTAVTFVGCKNFIVNGLRIMNAQQMHLTFQKCSDVRASNLVIRSPENSPNTDGIHVTDTKNVQIIRSLIKTGDDCISIVSGSKNVQATEIICGPGHGISIGSLGKGQSKAQVSDVLVNRARLSGTMNGVRIKTWQGGRGYAKNIIFQDIVMQNVSNPIIIDQHYCDQDKPCTDMKSAVHVNNVVYKNIRGTSATDIAIKLDCSKRHQCKGVVLQNINLQRHGKKRAEANCQNVSLVRRGMVSPGCSKET